MSKHRMFFSLTIILFSLSNNTTLFISAFTLILAIALANYLSGRPVVALHSWTVFLTCGVALCVFAVRRTISNAKLCPLRGKKDVMDLQGWHQTGQLGMLSWALWWGESTKVLLVYLYLSLQSNHSPQNQNSDIIYSPSCHYKPVFFFSLYIKIILTTT